MKIVEMKDLARKDQTLHYRREFSGTVVFEDLSQKLLEKKLEFILEHSPVGTVDIRVNLIEDVEYPLIPLIRTMKQYISDLDRKGKLP